MVPFVILDAPGLSRMDREVWMRLKRHAGSRGVTTVDQETLALEMGAGVRTIQRSLQKLRDADWIWQEPQAWAGGRPGPVKKHLLVDIVKGRVVRRPNGRQPWRAEGASQGATRPPLAARLIETPLGVYIDKEKKLPESKTPALTKEGPQGPNLFEPAQGKPPPEEGEIKVAPDYTQHAPTPCVGCGKHGVCSADGITMWCYECLSSAQAAPC